MFPVTDITPSGNRLPPHSDVVRTLATWDGKGRLAVQMSPHPPGRVLNETDTALHGIRTEMKHRTT